MSQISTRLLKDMLKMVSWESIYSEVEYIKSTVRLEDRLLIYLDPGKIISTCELAAA